MHASPPSAPAVINKRVLGPTGGGADHAFSRPASTVGKAGLSRASAPLHRLIHRCGEAVVRGLLALESRTCNEGEVPPIPSLPGEARRPVRIVDTPPLRASTRKGQGANSSLPLSSGLI